VLLSATNCWFSKWFQMGGSLLRPKKLTLPPKLSFPFPFSFFVCCFSSDWSQDSASLIRMSLNPKNYIHRLLSEGPMIQTTAIEADKYRSTEQAAFLLALLYHGQIGMKIPWLGSNISRKPSTDKADLQRLQQFPFMSNSEQ
jgi:hypothetical protein